MKDKKYDLAVIGGGPGGYTTAIRAAQRGMRVLLVESRAIGGTCLNRGCLPTKTLLEDTLILSTLRHASFLKGEMKINFRRIMERKSDVVERSVAGIIGVIRGNGVEIMKGTARFKGPKNIEVHAPQGEVVEITAERFVIATGAIVDYGPEFNIDEERILSTEGALALRSVPPSVAVVGAGNRGVEFAAMFHNLGSRVFLIEREKRILPREHRWLSGRYKKILTDRQMNILPRREVVAIQSEGEHGVLLTMESEKGLKELKVHSVLLTGNRRPFYGELDLGAMGLSLDGGALSHGEGMETKVKGIYVVGDAAGPPYLAHKAIAQGLTAVDHMQGRSSANGLPRFFPNCVYGDPEIGTVGMTDYEARRMGRKVRTGEFYFEGNGRAGTLGKTAGMVMIVSDEETDAVLGVHIMGPLATELVSLGVMAIENGLSLEKLRKTVLPHLTLSESFFEAGLASSGEAIHMLLEETGHEKEDEE